MRSKTSLATMETKTINKTPKDKLLGLLGIALKAGKLNVGTEQVCDSVRRYGHAERYGDDMPEENGKKAKIHKKAGCVIVASDASANTVKRILNACNYYNVNFFKGTATAAELSDRLGKSGNISAVSVFDKGFTNALLKIFEKPVK